MNTETHHFFSSAWEVFMLFAIPIGGGIPAGVLLAKSRGLSWVMMSFLYFLSDVALACVFEPLMKGVALASKKSPKMTRVIDVFRQSTQKTISRYGINPGPLSLIMIAFGVDPMTGRTAAFAAGHGFITGWAIAITGDMLYFGVIMVSTLWLNNILGDGTWTTIIIMAAMIFVPGLIQKIRQKKAAS